MQRQEFLSRWIEIIKKSSATLVYKQNFVNSVLLAVRGCSTRHTYDTAWARAVVEAVEEKNTGPDSGEIAVDLRSVSVKMVGYYWDQTVYFNLCQGPNPLRQPRVLRGVRELIKDYFRDNSYSRPAPFRKAVFSQGQREKLEQLVDTTLDIVRGEVLTRFQLKGQAREEFLSYRGGEETLYLPQAAASAIKENSRLLVEAIYYRWSQILEMYNTSPRLNRKVRIIDTDNLRDHPLSQFEKYLDIENPDRLCFYCGQQVTGNSPSMDHIIPWAYLCSDDVWNLVYAHQDCRPSEYGRVLPEFFLARLEKRNRALLEKLSPYTESDTMAGILQHAVTRGTVRRNWILCQD